MHVTRGEHSTGKESETIDSSHGWHSRRLLHHRLLSPALLRLFFTPLALLFRRPPPPPSNLQLVLQNKTSVARAHAHTHTSSKSSECASPLPPALLPLVLPLWRATYTFIYMCQLSLAGRPSTALASTSFLSRWPKKARVVVH